MKAKTILLVGRGRSAYEFDWSRASKRDIMAISSGVFTIPEGIKVKHFVAIDEPKFFMAQVMGGADHAWQHDEHNRHWPFWADASIVKHVPKQSVRHARNVPLPLPAIMQSLDTWAHESQANAAIVQEVREGFLGSIGSDGSPFGFQPGWADFQNIRGWEMCVCRRAKWGTEGPIALWRTDARMPFCNSLFMAVQVAARLGYKRFEFVGVDLAESMYADSREVMRRWCLQARRAGLQWVNLSPDSALAAFMPTVEGAACA